MKPVLQERKSNHVNNPKRGDRQKKYEKLIDFQNYPTIPTENTLQECRTFNEGKN
jgi:hypothetical protein